jgi:phosphotransferase system enzyme I (PtsI)
MGKVFKGMVTSVGLAISKVHIYEKKEISINKDSMLGKNTEKERLINAQKKTKKQLLKFKEKTLEIMGEDEAAIFDSHVTLLEDEYILNQIHSYIDKEMVSAEYALKCVIEENCNLLSQIEDEFFKERAADLKDIGKRWIDNILEIESEDTPELLNRTIIVSDSIDPSDIIKMDLKKVDGFVSFNGGKMSHASIMARSLGIPFIVGIELRGEVKNGEALILDAIEGKVIVNPDESEIKKYSLKIQKYKKEQENLDKLKGKKAISKDKFEVRILANVESADDIDLVLKYGADGIGLYRTEFLFMNSKNFPNEEEQYNSYKKVVERMEGKPVIIRTLDIGGDKFPEYMEFPKEDNPFLGMRALRIFLKDLKTFKTQIRAILRASNYGNVLIMFPMVISMDEVRKAKKLIEECKDELRQEGVLFDEYIKVGILVETPAVVMRAKNFAKEVEFFSIGTNDLTQYILAVDRGNEYIFNLYDPYNPAVLEAINTVIREAKKQKIMISMCGELSGDEKATALLLGMGLESFSMSPILIPKIKKNILSLDKRKCEKLVERILKMETADEIKEEINNFLESK